MINFKSERLRPSAPSPPGQGVEEGATWWGRRVRKWFADRYRGSAGTRRGRFVWAAAWIYFILALCSMVFLWFLADRWWPVSVFLFGPRWVLLAALPVLLLFSTRQRSSLIPLALATVILLGPVMGFRTGWQSWAQRGGQPDDLRVITFNVERGSNISVADFSAVISLEPDILALQECDLSIDEVVLDETDWFFEKSAGLCLLSRFPIDSVELHDRDVFGGTGYGGYPGYVKRTTLGTTLGPLFVTNLHFGTPRAGLENIRRGRIAQGAGELESSSALREVEARHARRWFDQTVGPSLILGDFNTPVESVIYQRHWGGIENAFSSAGFGFGATRLDGWIRVRIDHVLMSQDWRTVRAFVGPDLGSDHRPVIADLRRR